MLAVGLLAGCSEEKPKEEAVETVTQDTKKVTTTEWKETSFGEMKDVKGVTPLQEEKFKAGPMNVEITNVRIVEIKPVDKLKESFGNKETAKAIVADIKLENTVSEEIFYAPSQEKIVLDNGRSVRGVNTVEDASGGKMEGNQKSEGSTVWVLEDGEEDIKTFELPILQPADMNNQKQYEGATTLKFEVE